MGGSGNVGIGGDRGGNVGNQVGNAENRGGGIRVRMWGVRIGMRGIGENLQIGVKVTNRKRGEG